jgi:hypothetical protein
MSAEETRKLVELYFDNELERGRESLLFSILAVDEEAREYFRQLNIIHAAVKETTDNFPPDLEERIFHSIETKSVTSRIFRGNFFLNAASLGIAALMLIISSFLFFEMRDYRSKVEVVSEQVREQSQTIELIINNSLPPAEVRSRRVNEIIVNANL